MGSSDERLVEVANALYAASPGSFVADRDAQVRRARAEGERDLAARIAVLRRPTGSAWMVNALARERSDLLEQLVALGEQLREAQSSLAGDELRQLSAQRQQVVSSLVATAEKLARAAGVRADADASREVHETLSAALADPDVARAVMSGRLVKPARYAGFGLEPPELDLVPEAKATTTTKAAKTGAAAKGGAAKGGAAKTAPAHPVPSKADDQRAKRLAAAEQALVEAEADQEAREAEVGEREGARADAADRVDQLRAQLADAERRLAEASLDLRSARRTYDAAKRDVTKARAARERAAGGARPSHH